MSTLFQLLSAFPTFNFRCSLRQNSAVFNNLDINKLSGNISEAGIAPLTCVRTCYLDTVH